MHRANWPIVIGVRLLIHSEFLGHLFECRLNWSRKPLPPCQITFKLPCGNFRGPAQLTIAAESVVCNNNRRRLTDCRLDWDRAGEIEFGMSGPSRPGGPRDGVEVDIKTIRDVADARVPVPARRAGWA